MESDTNAIFITQKLIVFMSVHSTMIKQRITLLSNFIGEESANTEGLEITEESITVPESLYYSRQDRLSIPKELLSNDLTKLLNEFRDIRIQWKGHGFESSEIFQNFGQEGLFIHLLPSVQDYQSSIDELSQYLSRELKLDQFNNVNFITTATSATYHKLQTFNDQDLSKFISSLTHQDFKLDNTQDFELNWSPTTGLKIQWISTPSNTIITSSVSIRKEIAILQPKNSIPDIQLSGIRTIIGPEYTPPTKTLIYLKPRHFQTGHTANWELQKPVGLHPTMKLRKIDYEPPNSDFCRLFWVSTLPNRLIFDKYQYNRDKLQLLSSWGETDLEAPVWNVKQFGSVQFFEVLNNTELETTYHSRYIAPSSDPHTEFLTPQLFYACDAKPLIEDYEQVEANPFESYGLGYESFFDKDTVFFHLDNDPKVMEFDIPTAELQDFDKVQLITLSVVSIGTLYLLYKLFRAFTSTTKSIDSKKRA